MIDETPDERSLADALTPPNDASLEWMLISTHDFTSTAFVDDVLSAAIGDGSSNASRRRAMALGELDGSSADITIFACDRAMHQGTILHPKITVIGVAGRRLHAKCALLMFKSNVKPVRRVLRAVVTSANLTDSGLRKNREVVVVAEQPKRSKRVSLVTDVAEFFRSLIAAQTAVGLAADQRKKLTDRLKGLAPLAGTSADFVHSIGEKGILEQISTPSPKNVKRVVIVSPPFASPYAGIEEQSLRLLCGRGSPSIEVYTSYEAKPGVASSRPGVAFSRAALEELEAIDPNVSVRGVPTLVPGESDDAPHRRRRLHAKLIAVEWADGAVDVWSGSANYTRCGLLPGGNIEAMARVRVTGQELDAFLGQLDARPISREEIADSKESEFDGLLTEKLPVCARFKPGLGQNAGQARISGTLEVTWEGPSPAPQCRFAYPDETTLLDLAFDRPLGFRLDTDAGFLCVMRVEPPASKAWIPIEIKADEAFWAVPLEEPVDLGDPDWEAFLAAIERGRETQIKRAGDDAPVTAKAGGADDVFRLPLEQRVAMFARHRARLAQAVELDDHSPDLSHLFPTDSAAANVARVLLAHAMQTAHVTDDDLLDHLRGALEAFPNVGRSGVRP